MESVESQETEAYARSMGVTPEYIAEAEAAWNAGQIEMARLAALSDQDLQALYLQAYHNLRAHKPQLAARQFLALTQFDRRQSRFYVGLGLCFQEMREFGWAQGVYEVALEKDPEDRIALLLYGECALFLDGKAQAFKILSRGIAMGPRHPDDVAYIERAKGFLARIYREAKSTTKGIAQ